MMFAIMLLAAQPTPAEDEAWDHLKTRIELAPQEVVTFIERRTGCNHFDGEAGSDYPEREKQVQATRKELRCDDIEADTADLRHRYRNDPEVLKLLAETQRLMPW